MAKRIPKQIIVKDLIENVPNGMDDKSAFILANTCYQMDILCSKGFLLFYSGIILYFILYKLSCYLFTIGITWIPYMIILATIVSAVGGSVLVLVAIKGLICKKKIGVDPVLWYYGCHQYWKHYYNSIS